MYTVLQFLLDLNKLHSLLKQYSKYVLSFHEEFLKGQGRFVQNLNLFQRN